jgi:hypothetical protein
MLKEKTLTTNIKEDVVVNMDLVVTTTNKLL